MDTAAILISTAVLNTVSDGLMLVLPQRVIWDLSMPIKRKLGLSAAFLVTLLAFASSLVRLYFATRLKTSYDLSYNIGWLGIWTLPDIAIGFFIACLPFMPKFTKYVARRPIVSRVVVKIAIGFRQSLGKSHHYKKTGGYPVAPQVPQVPRPQAPQRIISDAEFEELVARTGHSSIETRPELENQRLIMCAQGDHRQDCTSASSMDPAQ
ncbi:hypothetical protein BU23DRAFT_279102 [Bimuria novae-zelandiae CBS 107.79]|uniref:Rhodopsin domain-containing protein n=1 Tax=Bimuria novae-zelandiae CBS 107.79 TaxID=1447943 RepID=A0A6A5UU58_9PLEO|nr:hypothetical protein BU23DRAFT_279102 [Bimuria novae-zelandiae CBS 107.79]